MEVTNSEERSCVNAINILETSFLIARQPNVAEPNNWERIQNIYQKRENNEKSDIRPF